MHLLGSGGEAYLKFGRALHKKCFFNKTKPHKTCESQPRFASSFSARNLSSNLLLWAIASRTFAKYEERCFACKCFDINQVPFPRLPGMFICMADKQV